jgi:hypothetical protein
VKIRFVAAETNPKHGAASVFAIGARPACFGRPVEIAVAALHQPGKWIDPIGADKAVKIRLRLCSGIEPSTIQNQDNDQWKVKALHSFSCSVSTPISLELLIRSRKASPATIQPDQNNESCWHDRGQQLNERWGCTPDSRRQLARAIS